MISTRGVRRTRARRGFSLLEVQAAFLILGFSVAALFPFAVAQYRLVGVLERRLPPDAQFALVSRDHRLVNLLAAGSGSTGSGSSTPPVADASQGPQYTGSVASSHSLRALVVESVNNAGGMSGIDMNAIVVVKQPATGG